jgi:hypothetical protein
MFNPSSATTCRCSILMKPMIRSGEVGGRVAGAGCRCKDSGLMYYGDSNFM